MNLQRILEKISFGAGLGMWNPKVLESHTSSANHPAIVVEITVPDSTGMYQFSPVNICETYQLKPLDLYNTEKEVARDILLCVMNLVRHEVQESFMFEGKRTFECDEDHNTLYTGTPHLVLQRLHSLATDSRYLK